MFRVLKMFHLFLSYVALLHNYIEFPRYFKSKVVSKKLATTTTTNPKSAMSGSLSMLVVVFSYILLNSES